MCAALLGKYVCAKFPKANFASVSFAQRNSVWADFAKASCDPANLHVYNLHMNATAVQEYKWPGKSGTV